MATIFSRCHQYRYTLDRNWLFGQKKLAWILLNPSTADAEIDDPTVRRCITFSKNFGYAGLTIVNLFAFRCTNPTLLKTTKNPVGPQNDHYISETVSSCDKTIIGWGNHGCLFNRDSAVLNLLDTLNVCTYVLGLTKYSRPKHPLYLKSESSLIRYPT